MAKAKSALRRAAALLAALCLAASMTLPVYAEGAEAADTTAIAEQADAAETPAPEESPAETAAPTETPQTEEPTPEPTAEPTAEPIITPEPTAEPTTEPTITPEITAEPTSTPKPTHTPEPTVTPAPDEDEAGFLNEDDSADDRMLTAGNAKESDIALCADDSAVPQGTKYTFYFAPPKGWGTGTITCSFMRGNDNRPKPSKDHEVRETTAQLITDKTTDGRSIYQVDVYHDDQDKDNSLCPYGGFVWVKFTLDNDHWVTMKGQGNEGNQWIKIEDIANKCLDGNKLAESSGGNTQSKAYDYDITKWVPYADITPKHVRYCGQRMVLLNKSAQALDSVTVTFWEKDEQNILKQVGTSQTINGLQTDGQEEIKIPETACAYVSFQKSDDTYIGGKRYFNFYNDEDPSDKIAVFPYDPVTRYCLIYTGDNDVRWSAPGSKTVYFDATFSDMSYKHDDAAKITYGMPDADGNLWCYITSENSEKPAITSKMARDGTSEIWYVDVPEGYTKIRFASWEVDNTNTADNGTGTDLLTIPDLNKPCFYADTSDDVIYQGGNRGGYWDVLGATRDAETGKKQKKQTVVDIKEKEFKNISGVKYISSTLYDYYTDFELNGNNRDDYDKMDHGDSFKQQRNWVTFRQFNRTISDYYNAATNKPNYPIYTGHFQSDEEGVWPPFSNLADTLDLYGWAKSGENNAAYRKFIATNNSKLDAQPNGPVFVNGTGKYSYTMLGLVADQLSGGTANGDLIMSGTDSLLEPHFNEAFLKGGNSRNAKIGEVYHDVLFPFTKNPNVFDDQDGVEYWWFDSSKTSLYMRQDTNTKGYYLGNKNTDEGHTSANCVDNNSKNVNAVSGTNNVSTTYGFFPFNETTTETSAEKYNYGFGAKLVIPFSLTADGQVQDKNGVNQPIRFYFSGDDDVWVYIDGQLALDIGGAHGKVSGILDFGEAENGGKVKVYVSCVKNNGASNSSSYGNMEDDANKTPRLSIRYVGDNGTTDYYYKDEDNVYIPNLTTGTHTLTMFYMERGMWESNMAVAYNFPDYNELQVEKEVKVDNVDEDFKKFFTDDSLKLFSVDIRNQATHFPAKDVTGSGSTPAAQTVTAFTSYRMKTKTNDDKKNYLKKEAPSGQNETENATTVHWYAAEDDRGGTIDGKLCSSYRNSRYGQIELATPLNISNMDTLTFQVYAPTENKGNENADPVSVEYLYLELEDENGKVVGCKGGETRDEAANTYLKDKVQGNASMPDNTWSMLKIDLTTWDKTRLDNVKYIRVGYDYARHIYFRNFTFSRSVVTTKAGFTTKQYDIPDYGTADNVGLAIPVGAQYTSNNKGDGGKTYAIGEDGQFDLANGEIVSFKDQFRRGSYISLREDTAGSLFDTRWEIYENDRLVQDMSTGDTVQNDVNGKEAPKPLCKDNDVAPDDSRAEVYKPDSVDGVPQANAGYKTTQKPKDTNTIVFRSYTNPDDTDQFTKLRVKFINTVKVGSLSITKLQPDGETYLNGKTFDFTIVFDNIGGLGLGGDTPVVKHVKGVEVGQTVKLDGIPVGTHFTITEDAKPGSFLKGAKLNDSAVNGSVVQGTITADGTVTAEFTNTARELFDITLDKQWLDANGEPLAHTGLPNVLVQLQRRVGNNEEWKAVDGYETVELRHSGQTDKWTATIKALDKYADPETKKKPYTYRVVEYSVDKDGNKTLDNGSGVVLGDYKYDPRYTYTNTAGDTSTDGITGGGSITITNTRQKPKYKLDITKQGIDGESKPVLLNGVEFTLEVKGADESYTAVTDGPQTTDGDGKCSFTELEPGSYRLTEVKTAEGYNLLAEPIEFKLTDDGQCTANGAKLGEISGDAAKGYTIALTINNRKGLTLPHTGADAPSLWVLIGLPLLVAGLLVLVFRYNRKGGKRS